MKTRDQKPVRQDSFQEVTDSNYTDDRIVELTPMTDFEPEGVSWLVEDRVAMGKVTLLAGDPGLGKSFLTLDMAARVTREGRHAAILSAEDDPSDTIRPRLDAMDADISRVHLVRGIVVPMGRVPHDPSLDTDVKLLATRLRKIEGLALVVIDPISAYMGKADSHNNAEVRRVLSELTRLAQWTGAAVVCVTHLNKDSAGKRAVYRSMGSLAFTAAARTVHLVTKHPNDEDKRVVSVVKNNLSAESAALVYTIDGGKVVWSNETIDMDADALDTPGCGRTNEHGPSALDEAKGFLLGALEGKEVKVRELYERSDARGISRDALNRAKRTLGVRSRRNRDAWHWSMPAQADPCREPTADEIEDAEDLADLALMHGYEPNGFV